MEPFSIQCESCHSRLKVRKRSTIGQTLTCPKCKAPVKVLAPEEWADQPAAIGDAAIGNAAKEESISKSAKVSEKRASRAAKESGAAKASSDVAVGDFEDMDNLLANIGEQAATLEPTARSEPGAAALEDLEDDQPSGASTESGPLLPNNDWLSESSKSRQKLFTFIGCSIAAVLLAGVMIAYLIFQMSRPATETLANNEGAAETESSNEAESTETAEVSSDDNSQTSPEDDANDSNTNLTDDSVQPSTDLNNGDDPETSNGTDQADANQNNTNPQSLTDDGEVDSGNPIETSDDRSTDDVANSSDDSPPGFRINEDASSNNILNDPILGGLGDLDRLVEDDGSADARDAALRQRREGSWSVLDADAPFVETPRSIEINIPSQLSMEILELKQDNLELLEFADLISRLSGVPVSVNAIVLQQVNARDDAVFNLHVVEQSIGDAIRDTLRPFELDYLELSNSIEIVPESMLTGIRESSYDVADLLEGFPDRQEDLILIIRSLIHPESWDEQGGAATIYEKDGSLYVEQSNLNHDRIKVFLNLLRLARGLPSYDETICGPEQLQPHAVANDCLQERFELEIYQPTKLADVIQRLNETANITVLVNWESLVGEGWNWDTKLPLVVDDQSVEFALRRIAVSLDVAYRVVGPRQFELLSKSEYETTTNFGFYNCGPLLAAGIEIDSIASQVRNVFPLSNEQPVYPFYYDSASQHIIARLTQAELATLQKFMSAWERTALSRK